MKLSRKSKRVSWAPGFDLCQVKLFLSEDSPSKISVQAEDHLQRTSMMLQHLISQGASDVPPGFECSRKLNQSKDEATCIPMVEWRHPPKFVMSRKWHVAAGEESQEKDSQMHRQMGLLEAIYPRLSSIPQSPSVTLEVEVEHYNDILTPIMPLIPIEEAEAADIPNDVVEPLNTPSQSTKLFNASEKPNITDAHNHNSKPSIPQTPHLLLSPNSDVSLVTAASAALAATMKSEEQGSLIDTDLLVKIFNDPKMIEKLINDSRALTSAVAPEVGVSKPNLIPPFCSNPPKSFLLTGADLIPPLCRNPPSSSSLTGANDKFHDMHNLMQSTSMPGKTLIFPTSRSPTSLVTPMPSNGPLHVPTTNLKAAITRVSQLSDTQPVSGLKPVAPSVSIPPVQVVRDLYPKRTIVEPTFSTITQVNTSPISSPMSLMSIAVPNHVPPTARVVPSKSHIGPQPPMAAMKINPLKDVNYIKNLIKEHGRDEREKPNPNMLLNGTHLNHVQNIEMAQNVNMAKLKRKFDEPCVYFKTSRGCRRGSNCPYKHDLTFQWQNGIMDASGAKRMKLGGEIFGR